MNTIKLQINQNEGLSKGNPIVPDGWWVFGGKFGVSPNGQQWFRASEAGPDGIAPLYDTSDEDKKKPGYIQFMNSIAVTPFDNVPTQVVKVTDGKALPLPTPNPSTPAFVPGRTMAQAQALGDVWGFTRDPSAG